MILSVIIVNYRVRYFLELCLHSVEKALRGLDAEILVVDNHSADGSMEFLRPLFPRVKFIVNTENRGFARANNQALEQARGEYILFLNPDTILPEDIVPRCLSFLRSTPRIGGLGLRMIDGSGRFLKESRRGFPSPWVAFCKLSGLTALFPHSRLFSTYYLGYLPADSHHPSPVLSGACLWVSRAILDETGSFDEDFFMYAEDIDLSYRLEKAGYVNYYFADATIVHFKGESTQKDTRYTRQFYKAMSQFRRKHFNGGLPRLFGGALEAAIWLRAGLGAIGRMGGRTPRGAAGRAVAISAPRRTWLTGDPAEVERLQSLLTHAGERTPEGTPETPERTLAPDGQQAEEIIFCEGDGFSFSECIAALEAAALYRKGQCAKFHAAGSASAVGSARRDGQGETWLLKGQLSHQIFQPLPGENPAD
jgi:N-acetylglucosaminyl-diphospho-decaprenol L-rhamnosyltransferase